MCVWVHVSSKGRICQGYDSLEQNIFNAHLKILCPQQLYTGCTWKEQQKYLDCPNQGFLHIILWLFSSSITLTISWESQDQGAENWFALESCLSMESEEKQLYMNLDVGVLWYLALKQEMAEKGC